MRFRDRRFYILNLVMITFLSADFGVLCDSSKETVAFDSRIGFYLKIWDRFSRLKVSSLLHQSFNDVPCYAQGGYRYGRMERTGGMLVVFDITTNKIRCSIRSSTFLRKCHYEGILRMAILLTHCLTDVLCWCVCWMIPLRTRSLDAR